MGNFRRRLARVYVIVSLSLSLCLSLCVCCVPYLVQVSHEIRNRCNTTQRSLQKCDHLEDPAGAPQLEAPKQTSNLTASIESIANLTSRILQPLKVIHFCVESRNRPSSPPLVLDCSTDHTYLPDVCGGLKMSCVRAPGRPVLSTLPCWIRT